MGESGLFQALRKAYRRNALLAVPLLAAAWLVLACQSCLAAVAGDGVEGAAGAEHHCCPDAVQTAHHEGCDCGAQCLSALPDSVQPPALAKSVDEKPAPALVALVEYRQPDYPVVWQIPPPRAEASPGDPLLLARKCLLLL
ncbi:MAG TPA: hypothetical protein ENK54_02045 [Thiotrichales bacterium]|nr:hypothetical protein [Thiotrichales bacterium]